MIILKYIFFLFISDTFQISELIFVSVAEAELELHKDILR